MFGTAPRTVTYTVSAIYHVGNERYDRYVVFLPIEAAKNFFGYDEGYPIVGVRLTDPNAAETFVRRAREQEKPYRMQSWIERNGTYVTALVVERNVMRLILFIVVVITALNIITGVLMLVKNKARDIAILRTIGATRAGVVRIFMMTGTVLGMAGVGTGVAARCAVRDLHRRHPALPRRPAGLLPVPAGHLSARRAAGEAGVGRGRLGRRRWRSWSRW